MRKELLNEIHHIKDKYVGLRDYGEENVKVKIIKPLIELLGFQEEWQEFEYPVIKGKRLTDISIIKNGKLEFIIEVKKGGDYKVNRTDKHQLLSYLMEKNIEWGIITNGEMLYLLNYKINAETEYREVLNVNLLDESTYHLFEYLSFDSIFVTRKTNYFKHLAEFTNYFKQENDKYNSWNRYYSAIYNYFMYLIENYPLYRELEYLSVADFKDFINSDIEQSINRKKVVKSKVTVINKFRYIKKLYELFVKNKELAKNPFSFVTDEEVLIGIKNINLDNDDLVDDISEEMIEDYYELINNGRENTVERNRIIFALCLYAGLDRDEIRHIKISDINVVKKTLIVNGVEIPLHHTLLNKITNYIENFVGSPNREGHHLFSTNRNKLINTPLSTDIINSVFSDVNSLPNAKLKLNLTKIRNLLIRKLFEAGFTIDEIITITRTDIKIVANLISSEEIIERTSIDSLAEKHPFKSFIGKL